MDSLEELKHELRLFAKARNWEQFHTPKNLAMALTAEAGELIEQFQWLTETESANLSSQQLQAVADEIADVQLYLIQLADQLKLDILMECSRKMQLNAQKYPPDRSD